MVMTLPLKRESWAAGTSALHEEFLSTMCADEELVRAEFEAMILACWDEPVPPRKSRPPGPPVGQPGQYVGRWVLNPVMRTRKPEFPRWARQRSPPPLQAFRSCPSERQVMGDR